MSFPWSWHLTSTMVHSDCFTFLATRSHYWTFVIHLLPQECKFPENGHIALYSLISPAPKSCLTYIRHLQNLLNYWSRLYFDFLHTNHTNIHTHSTTVIDFKALLILFVSFFYSLGTIACDNHNRSKIEVELLRLFSLIY